MPRLGKFTGRIYEDDYDFSQCPECCTIIPNDIVEDKEKLDEWIRKRRIMDNLVCLGCYGCPAAN